MVIDLSQKRLSRFHSSLFVVILLTSIKYLHTDMHDATLEKIQETKENVEEGLVEPEKGLCLEREFRNCPRFK